MNNTANTIIITDYGQAHRLASAIMDAASEINYTIERQCLMLAQAHQFDGKEMKEIATFQERKFSAFHNARQCCEVIRECWHGSPELAQGAVINGRRAIEQLHTIQYTTNDMIAAVLAGQNDRIDRYIANAFTDY